MALERKLREIVHRCRTINQLKQTHAQVLLHGLQHHSPHLLSKLINASSSSLYPLTHAVHIFQSIPSPDIATHNHMIKAFNTHRRPLRALSLYITMRASGLFPNSFTFTSLFATCHLLGCCVVMAEQVHAQILRCGFGSHLFVLNALVDVYAKARAELEPARKVFDEMPERDVVSWNSMVGAYVGRGDVETALSLFESMPERSVVSWNLILLGLVKVGEMCMARVVFERMPARNAVSWNTMITAHTMIGDMKTALAMFNEMEGKTVVSWTAMITGYARIGDLLSMRELFDALPIKNAVSWNAVIAAYNRNSRYGLALEAFRQMLTDGTFMPDEVTLISVTSACTQLGALEYGNWVYSYIRKNHVHVTVPLGNALIDMFAKCGDAKTSHFVFRQMARRCVITWTTTISGLGLNGKSREAVALFEEMCVEGVRLDEVVFIAVLTACAHGGLVEEGQQIYGRMRNYGVEPTAKHQGCIVDLLSRAGKVEEAIEFIGGLQMEPEVVTWASLLSSCRTQGKADVIDYVSKKIVEKKSLNSGYKVLVSNSKALVGRWQEAAGTRHSMRREGLQKVPGCSSIQVGDKVHEFMSTDTEHQMRKEVYDVLTGLTWLSCQDTYEPFMLEIQPVL